MVYMEKF